VLYYSRDALRDVQLQLVWLQLSPRIALVWKCCCTWLSILLWFCTRSCLAIEAKAPHNTAQH